MFSVEPLCISIPLGFHIQDTIHQLLYINQINCLLSTKVCTSQIGVTAERHLSPLTDALRDNEITMLLSSGSTSGPTTDRSSVPEVREVERNRCCVVCKLHLYTPMCMYYIYACMWTF